jgi:hypothetical protein
MATTREDVRNYIRSASSDDLETLFVSMRARFTALDMAAKEHFSIGDLVKFDSGRRGIIQGTITRFGRNGRVEVRPPHGPQWRVSGRLLRAAADPKPPPVDRALPPSGSANDDEF